MTKKNVKVAQTLFSVLEKKKRKEDLKCFTLISDRRLKNILEESDLFHHRATLFDDILFNINELGIKFGIEKRKIIFSCKSF